jgi:hypothetical protein
MVKEINTNIDRKIRPQHKPHWRLLYQNGNIEVWKNIVLSLSLSSQGQKCINKNETKCISN